MGEPGAALEGAGHLQSIIITLIWCLCVLLNPQTVPLWSATAACGRVLGCPWVVAVTSNKGSPGAFVHKLFLPADPPLLALC